MSALKKILFADDSEHLAETQAALAATIGYEADFALSASEALAKMSAYDLVVVALNFPDRETGRQVIAEAIACNRPVVVLSLELTERSSLIAELLHAGALMCQPKPFGEAEIKTMLDEAFRLLGRILYVDRNAELVNSTAAALEQLGYDVDVATSVTHANGLLAQRRYAVAILDMNTGADKVLERWGLTGVAPMVVISKDFENDESKFDQLFDAGARNCIVKEDGVQYILRIIEEYAS